MPDKLALDMVEDLQRYMGHRRVSDSLDKEYLENDILKLNGKNRLFRPAYDDLMAKLEERLNNGEIAKTEEAMWEPFKESKEQLYKKHVVKK